mgnify:CR=1 FL=1
MEAILKRPGEPAKVVSLGTTNDIHKLLGGEFEPAPILRGAQVLTLASGDNLVYNTTFLGYRYCGPLLIVGRGENEQIISLSKSIQRLTLNALGEKK